MNGFPATVALIPGLAALGVPRRHSRNGRRLRLHEMAHQERMLVMAQGLPVSQVPAGWESDGWLDQASTERPLDAGSDRRMALALALVMLTASLGALLLARWLPASSTDLEEIRLAASPAVIPLMGSFGLLLDHRFTRPGQRPD